MLKICLVIWKSEPQYVYKRYACKKCILHYNLGDLQYITLACPNGKEIKWRRTDPEGANIKLLYTCGDGGEYKCISHVVEKYWNTGILPVSSNQNYAIVIKLSEQNFLK